MVTIETEHGTYTGDDVKAATRAAKKGEALAAKARRAKDERCKVSYTRAESNGYRLLVRKLGNGFTRWELARPGDNWFPVEVKDTDTPHPRQVVKFEIVEATGGCVVHDCGYSHTVEGIVRDAAGWTVGVFFKDSAGAVELYAIGAHEDTYAFVLVPSVTMEDFPKRDE